MLHWYLLTREGFKYGCGEDPTAALDQCWVDWGLRSGVTDTVQKDLDPEHPFTIAILSDTPGTRSIGNLHIRSVGRNPRVHSLRGRTYIGWIADRDLRDAPDDVAHAIRNGLLTVQHILIRTAS